MTDPFDDRVEELRRARMAELGRPLTPKEYWEIRDSLLTGWVPGDLPGEPGHSVTLMSVGQLRRPRRRK